MFFKNVSNTVRRCFCTLLCLTLLLSSVLFPVSALADSKGVTNAKVVLRESSSQNSKALQTIPEGEEVTITRTSGSWYRVRYSGQSGYLMKKYVDKASSSSSAAKSIAALGSAPGIMRVGDSNNDVLKLQTALDILGYYDGKLDGKYGDGTKEAVANYQKDEGLTADGYAGERTVKSIFGSCSSRSLTTQPEPGSKKSSSSSSSAKSKYKTVDSISEIGSAPGKTELGDSGTNVVKLQQALECLGYYDGAIDGDFGEGTEAAVKRFQSKRGMKADGIAGSSTIRVLFGSSSSGSSSGSSGSSSSSSAKYKTEVLDWYKDNVSRVIPKNARFTVKDIATGRTPIDVAFIAAPTADPMGNCSGKYGKSACGSLGYAYADAMYAKKVVVITDNLVSYPLQDWSISESYVDYVVAVDAIGDPKGIVSGTTRITRDPVGLVMASHAAKVIEASGLLKDGFSFQTGAGGASLAAAKFLKDIMLEKNIRGSFGLGGITGYMVDMLQAGCFQSLLDVQCFDLKAVESLRNDPRHQEISAMHYAAPGERSAVVDSLDVVILGATEIDTDFNVNVHTDSNGYIMGGSGGHSDTAAGAKLSMIIAPMFRARMPIVTDQVTCISTPGENIDVLVTQGGIAVNPARVELRKQLTAAGLPVVDIQELKEKTERITGAPRKLPHGDRVVAEVIGRNGNLQDRIYSIR